MPVKLVVVAAALMIAAAAAREGAVEVTDAWARATLGKAENGAAYLTLSSPAPDRLTRLSTPVAAKAELHLMTMEGGVMTMRPVEGGLEIKPGQTVVLNPESLHLMLIGLKQPLVQGERVKATLDFAKAGKLDLEYVVESMGAQSPSNAAAPAGMDHGAMDHTHMKN